MDLIDRAELKKKYPTITWIADLRDPWTEIYYNKDLYQTSWAKNKNLRYERSVLANANHIITVSEDCARLFSNKVVATLPITVLWRTCRNLCPSSSRK